MEKVWFFICIAPGNAKNFPFAVVNACRRWYIAFEAVIFRLRGINMKNKPLKHYNRKKFFYRFFMLKSPRQGTMFGLALMNMNIALWPEIIWSQHERCAKTFTISKKNRCLFC